VLELLAGPDTGANSMFTQRCGMECVSNTHAHISVFMEKIQCNLAIYIFMSPFSGRRTVRKTLLEEVQELEARAVDPRAAVLRDASGRRYVLQICFE